MMPSDWQPRMKLLIFKGASCETIELHRFAVSLLWLGGL